MQLGSRQGQAGTDVAPELVQIDLDQAAPALVKHALAGEEDPPGRYRNIQTQRSQGADTVGRQIHTGPSHVPAGLPFDHLRGEARLTQRPGQGQAGKPGAHNQDPSLLHVILRSDVIFTTLIPMARMCALEDRTNVPPLHGCPSGAACHESAVVDQI